MEELSPEILKLLEERDKLVLARDILLLKVEIQELKNQINQDGHTDTKKSQS